ncbi:unnamed protein product [Hapterophycus canaliculatus]
MYSACDIEGHASEKDGRHYLLDFSRSFPPEDPREVPRGWLAVWWLFP